MEKKKEKRYREKFNTAHFVYSLFLSSLHAQKTSVSLALWSQYVKEENCFII